ncbi:MAG: hypothetical protein ACI4W2_07320 [Eubacterium sp.]
MKRLSTHKKTIAFVLLFFIFAAAMMVYLTKVFDMKDDKHAEQTFASFYAQKKNSLDGVYIGSSSVYRYWISTQAYQKYGMRIFNLSTGSQPVVLQKYVIKEALKKQPDMKVILIDIRSLVSASKTLKESDIRRVTDSMPMSVNRIQAVNAALKYFKAEGADISYNKSYYYFSFLFYHNRWSDDLSRSDLNPKTKQNPYMGFVYDSASTDRYAMKAPEYVSGTGSLDAEKKAVLKDLLDYCSTLKQKVIFVSSPYQSSASDQKDLHSCEKMIRKKGFTFIDFNSKKMTGRIKLNWSTDFLNTKHVNINGAEKYTKYLSAWLNQHVRFRKHTDSASKAAWDKAAAALNRKLS